MNILIVHNDYQLIGGETAICKAELKLLRDTGHSIATYFRDNSEINHYNILQKSFFFPNTFFSTRTYQDIKKIIEQFKPDIAHIHNVFPLISPSVYKALHDKNIPMVQTVHNFRFLCPNGLFLTHGHICELCKYGNTSHAVALKCYRNSFLLSTLYALSIGLHRKLGTFDLINRFIVLTDFTRHKLVESGFTNSNKITTLGNFIPAGIPGPILGKPKIEYIAYIGRLSEEKGLSVILNKFDQITQNVELRIAGSGPDFERLQEMAKVSNGGRIKIVGPLYGKDKWDFLKNAGLIVIPSICYENFPLVALESMAVGTPVIASNIGGLPYIIDNGKNGLLFEPGDSVELITEISSLINEPKRLSQFAEEAVKTVSEKYSEEVHYKKLMEIYSQVLDEQGN